MAYYKFTRAILAGDSIDIYNNGLMQRDFTYIDDIISGLLRVMRKLPGSKASDYSTAVAPYEVFNIGNNNPVSLKSFIQAIETACGRNAEKNYLPMQQGDVPVTFADVDSLTKSVGFKPETQITEGIEKFVKWYIQHVESDRL